MLNADLIIGCFTACLAILVYLVTRDLSRLGGVFVNYILVGMAVLSGLVIVKGLLRPERLRFFESTLERNNILIGLLILLVYLILLPLVGFLPSSFGFYFTFNLYLGEERFATRNLFKSAVLTSIVVPGFYIMFHHFLEVPLPTGSLFN